MKKLLSIMLLLATMLTFAACEDKNEPEKNPFVGKWECIVEYHSARTLKIVYELTIKKDYSAELIQKNYEDGIFREWNTTLYTCYIDDTKDNKTIYLFYSTENEGYNPIYSHTHMRGVISGEELIIVTFSEDLDGNYVDNDWRYFEYTKK